MRVYLDVWVGLRATCPGNRCALADARRREGTLALAGSAAAVRFKHYQERPGAPKKRDGSSIGPVRCVPPPSSVKLGKRLNFLYFFPPPLMIGRSAAPRVGMLLLACVSASRVGSGGGGLSFISNPTNSRAPHHLHHRHRQQRRPLEQRRELLQARQLQQGYNYGSSESCAARWPFDPRAPRPDLSGYEPVPPGAPLIVVGVGVLGRFGAKRKREKQASSEGFCAKRSAQTHPSKSRRTLPMQEKTHPLLENERALSQHSPRKRTLASSALPPLSLPRQTRRGQMDRSTV